MEWAVEVEDMTVAYTTKPVLWDVDMKVPIGSLAAMSALMVPVSPHY